MDGPCSMRSPLNALLNNLDDPAAMRFDQNSPAVYNRVPIVPRAIFRRHIVVSHAFLRKNGANPYILAVVIGRVMPLDDIAVKARPFIDAENSVHAADHPADHAADDRADGTGCSFAFS
jgi:hypothetical protein